MSWLLIGAFHWAFSQVNIPLDMSEILFKLNEIWAHMGPEIEGIRDEQLGGRQADRFKPVKSAY